MGSRDQRVAVTVEHCWHRVPGGTARATALLTRALAARDDLEVVGVAAHHRQAPAPTFDPGIPVRHLPLSRSLCYEAWHRLRIPAIERLTGPVDVVHAPGGVIPPSRAPLVVTVHDLAWQHYPAFFTRRGLRFFRRAHELTVRHAARVICPSTATRDDCVAHGIDPAIVRVVPWGVDRVPEADAATAAAAVQGRLGLERPYVLAVGTVEPRKNLARLVEAAGRLRADVDLVVVGPSGWHGALASLQAEAGPRVRFVGFVDDATLSGLYAGCAVFCYPSVFEGFGMPVLEAMAHGCAVVTSARTATEEVVGDAGVVVDPTDVSALADAIDHLLVDDAARADLGRAARRRAAAYTWDATASATAAVYGEVW